MQSLVIRRGVAIVLPTVDIQVDFPSDRNLARRLPESDARYLGLPAQAQPGLRYLVQGIVHQSKWTVNPL
jgi:hypothetical protein